ncbi:FAD-binding oxidoreductase [Corynebacterium diphtheriae]|uniref:FAD-binding oxidoreductase n=1 Tax=Corynebacterium diphtheriae TaxID=1717 RepID=UPI0013C559AD|nr:FAD-dependent oxidoreductase [Corynebacterium diphtheriae]CAB0798370.1 FAD-binding oxidoreductase [Corynebacterium diphtheriae]CAB0800400.1 FAD-binding oxidoreductase [Corynebacterium diphtheriae]CAB0834873.1 FAD-binding oxidoreductase [Corynebacterium diphtheriae]CAB0905035.1 FAD-binding oxidoreductase [Corynebacterium diphtheriae]
MQFARNHGQKLTFRAEGSSLYGQAKLWARSGVVLGDAQAVLGRQGVMLAPEPGSTAVCTIGGVIADNSRGMRCSVERDAYHSIVDARIVLPSGTINPYKVLPATASMPCSRKTLHGIDSTCNKERFTHS